MKTSEVNLAVAGSYISLVSRMYLVFFLRQARVKSILCFMFCFLLQSVSCYESLPGAGTSLLGPRSLRLYSAHLMTKSVLLPTK